MMDLMWDEFTLSKNHNPLTLKVTLTLNGDIENRKIINLPNDFAEDIIKDYIEIIKAEITDRSKHAYNQMEKNSNLVTVDIESNFGDISAKDINSIIELNGILMQIDDMTNKQVDALRALLEIIPDINKEELKYAVENIIAENIILLENVCDYKALGKQYYSNKGSMESLDEEKEETKGKQLFDKGLFSFTSYGAIGSWN